MADSPSKDKGNGEKREGKTYKSTSIFHPDGVRRKTQQSRVQAIFQRFSDLL